MRRADGIKDEIERIGRLLHASHVTRQNHLTRAKSLGIVRLAGRRGEQHHFGTHRLGEFDAHVTKTAQANNTYARVRTRLPFAKRRVCRDARAQQRRNTREIEIGRHAQHKLLVHHDAFRIPTLRWATCFLLNAAVRSRRTLLTKLLKVLGTRWTGLAAIDQTTHAHEIANFVRGNCLSNGQNTTNNFVSRNLRIFDGSPLGFHRMQVRVTHAAKENFKMYIVGTNITSFEVPGTQR